MEEKLKCKWCGARFRQERVDDALEAEELVCRHCGHLFTKVDLGPRGWRRPPPDAGKLRLWWIITVIVVLVVRDQPGLALFAAISILVGLLFAWLMSRARRNDAPISIIARKAPR